MNPHTSEATPSTIENRGGEHRRATRVMPLDGIRAIAILVVIVFHTTADAKYPLDALGPAAFPILHGWMGVDLFFALSGFLITRLWLADEAASPFESWVSRARRFYARRALRILPLYYVTFFLFLALAYVVDLRTIAHFAKRVAEDPSSVVSYLLLSANYARFHRDGAFAARWSICVEEHFYLLWPLVLLLIRGRRARLATAIGTCIGFIALRKIGLEFADHRSGWASYSMIRYSSHLRMDAILWGCVTALAYEALARAVWIRRCALLVLTVAVVAFVATDELSILKRPTAWGASFGYAALSAAAAMLAAEVTAAPTGLLARALTLRPLPALGYHSYAVYLVHPLAIEVSARLVFPPGADAKTWRFLLTLGMTLAMSLLGAMALHATVERPFLALRARFRIPKRSPDATLADPMIAASARDGAGAARATSG